MSDGLMVMAHQNIIELQQFTNYRHLDKSRTMMLNCRDVLCMVLLATLLSKCAGLTIHRQASSTRTTSTCTNANKAKSPLYMSSEPSPDDIFGAEFISKIPRTLSSIRSSDDLKIKIVDRRKVMKGYENLRLTYFLDSILVSALGLAVVWLVGTYRDSVSYLVGSGLGICYSLLLGRYIERLGTMQENKASDGIRFVPVILLVALYGKFHDLFSIIPEVIGFIVSYQVSGFLQMFNEDPYNENEPTKK